MHSDDWVEGHGSDSGSISVSSVVYDDHFDDIGSKRTRLVFSLILCGCLANFYFSAGMCQLRLRRANMWILCKLYSFDLHLLVLYPCCSITAGKQGDVASDDDDYLDPTVSG